MVSAVSSHKIGIVDIGLGNIGSLKGALFSQGWDIKLVSSAQHFSDLSHLILPGVGAFGEAVLRLHGTELFDQIQLHVKRKRPLLGICLGMQLLATKSNELGVHEGLDLIPGEVHSLDISPGIRVPHAGWNEVQFVTKHPLLEGVKVGSDFYFVHSYYFNPKDNEDIIGKTDYGIKFASVVANKNVVGLQFHPEKSQRNGIKILDNFCMWDGIC